MLTVKRSSEAVESIPRLDDVLDNEILHRGLDHLSWEDPDTSSKASRKTLGCRSYDMPSWTLQDRCVSVREPNHLATCRSNG